MFSLISTAAHLFVDVYNVRALPPLAIGRPSHAYWISSDGHIVIGSAQNTSGEEVAVEWVDANSPRVIAQGYAAVGSWVNGSQRSYLLLRDEEGLDDAVAVSNDFGIQVLGTGRDMSCAVNSFGQVGLSGFNAANKLVTSTWTESGGTVPFLANIRIFTVGETGIIGGQLNWNPAYLAGQNIHIIVLYGGVDGRIVALSKNNNMVMTVAFTKNVYRAYTYTSSGGAERFQFISGSTHLWPKMPSMVPKSINSSGTIVGWYGSAQDPVAWVKSQPTQAYDASLLLDKESDSWTIKTLDSINDSGQCVGVGKQTSGVESAVVLTPRN